MPNCGAVKRAVDPRSHRCTFVATHLEPYGNTDHEANANSDGGSDRSSVTASF